MIGLALSGGGSRAIAFHLGCLRALNDIGLLEKIQVLSTISGGSLIGAYYAYTPQKAFAEFESEMRQFLQQGFQWELIAEFLKPLSLMRCTSNYILFQIFSWTGLLTRQMVPFHRYPSRTDMFQRVLDRKIFGGLAVTAPTRNNMEVVIGASELRSGSSFRFGNRKSGSWKQGEIIDGQIDLAFAVAASAAYPLLLPSLDRTFSFRKDGQVKKQRVLLADGGIYDNLGLQVLEPKRDPEFSLHTFPCQYLISCNAGYGQYRDAGIPVGPISRMARSIEIVHQRVQNSTMHQLHQFKELGLIKGFALPYLGQRDDRLPWHPGNLVPWDAVVSYATNFSAMDNIWIDKLSMRGEQLTRALVSLYLRELVAD